MLNKKERYYFLDYVRAAGIIFVVVYHFFFNLSFIFDIKLSFLNWAIFDFIRDIFVAVLIFLSGISCSLSKSNLRRGIKISALALCISIVTYFVFPSQFISFGIIAFFGFSLIAVAIFENILLRLNYKLSAFIFLTVFVILKFFNIEELITYKSHSFLLFVLGISPNAYISADYYPVLPWIFALISGFFAGKLLFSYELPNFMKKNPFPLLAFIGRHTLEIYILHQPIILGLMMLIF